MSHLSTYPQRVPILSPPPLSRRQNTTASIQPRRLSSLPDEGQRDPPSQDECGPSAAIGAALAGAGQQGTRDQGGRHPLRDPHHIREQGRAIGMPRRWAHARRPTSLPQPHPTRLPAADRPDGAARRRAARELGGHGRLPGSGPRRGRAQQPRPDAAALCGGRAQQRARGVRAAAAAWRQQARR